MKYYNAALLVSLLSLAACYKQIPDSETTKAKKDNHKRVETTPYVVDMNISRAMLTRYYIIVYFVADSNNIIKIDIPMSKGETQGTHVPIGLQQRISATLYKGPNVMKYVITSGASPLPPTYQKSYSKLQAISGFVTYNCSAPNKKLPPKRKIMLSLDQINFNDGKLYSIKTKTFTAYPPPP